jgi:hypothetical protein
LGNIEMRKICELQLEQIVLGDGMAMGVAPAVPILACVSGAATAVGYGYAGNALNGNTQISLAGVAGTAAFGCIGGVSATLIAGGTTVTSAAMALTTVASGVLANAIPGNAAANASGAKCSNDGLSYSITPGNPGTGCFVGGVYGGALPSDIGR